MEGGEGGKRSSQFSTLVLGSPVLFILRNEAFSWIPSLTQLGGTCDGMDLGQFPALIPSVEDLLFSFPLYKLQLIFTYTLRTIRFSTFSVAVKSLVPYGGRTQVGLYMW